MLTYLTTYVVTNKSANSYTVITSDFGTFLDTNLSAIRSPNAITHNGTINITITMAIKFAVEYTIICSNFPTDFEAVYTTFIISIHETVVPTNDGANRSTFIFSIDETFVSANDGTDGTTFVTAIDGTISPAVVFAFVSTVNSALFVANIAT